jgi:pyruvate carboxylase
VGVATNIPYLRQIIDHPDFISGNIDTGFLDRHEVVAEEPVARQREAAELAALLFVTSGGDSSEPVNGNHVALNVANQVAGGNAWRRQMSGSQIGTGMGRWPRSI